MKMNKDNSLLEYTCRHCETDTSNQDECCEMCRSFCLECNESIDLETDLQLCSKCMELFDTDRLWAMHDNNELDALDFNESAKMREKFRLVINK